MRAMSFIAVSALGLLVCLGACGGGSDGSPGPNESGGNGGTSGTGGEGGAGDGGEGGDGGQGGDVDDGCTPVELEKARGGYIGEHDLYSYISNLSTSIGGPNYDALQIVLHTNATGTIDLGSSKNANNQTCEPIANISEFPPKSKAIRLDSAWRLKYVPYFVAQTAS